MGNSRTFTEIMIYQKIIKGVQFSRSLFVSRSTWITQRVSFIVFTIFMLFIIRFSGTRIPALMQHLSLVYLYVHVSVSKPVGTSAKCLLNACYVTLESFPKAVNSCPTAVCNEGEPQQARDILHCAPSLLVLLYT